MYYLYWAILALILLHYVMYPAGIIICGKAGRVDNEVADIEFIEHEKLPQVSFIIAAYNEEDVIEEKLENTLALNYPKDKIEIIVAAHGSTDSTHTIASSYKAKGVISLYSEKREGKSIALNYGVAKARHEIIVFSDANNMFSDDALLFLVRHFQNPRIGGVCGRKNVSENPDRQAAQGDSLYWKYESAIKNYEGKCYSITGADGEIFALRKKLFLEIGQAVINDDLTITYDLVNAGYRVIYEDKAISTESASISLVDDYHVKVRMVAGGFQFINMNYTKLLTRDYTFLWMFFCHKVLRWCMPLLLLSLIILSLLLLDYSSIKLLFIAQIVFYLAALSGLAMLGQVHKIKLLYIPTYFCLMNAAALHGLLRYLFHTQPVNWRRAQRQ